MRRKMIFALVFVGGLSAQTGTAKQVKSSDPIVSRELEALSHPTQATAEVQEIKIPAGEYTHCSTTTNGNRSSSDCSLHNRFEEIHRLVLHVSWESRSIEVIGGCSSYERDRRCGNIALGGMGSPECREIVDRDGVATHYECSEQGSGTFVVEREKKGFFIYPVEGKPNRRYYIPLASIDGATIIPD